MAPHKGSAPASVAVSGSVPPLRKRVGPVAMPVPSFRSFLRDTLNRLGCTTQYSRPPGHTCPEPHSTLEAFTQSGFTSAPRRERPHVVDGGVDRHLKRFRAAGGVGQ